MNQIKEKLCEFKTSGLIYDDEKKSPYCQACSKPVSCLTNGRWDKTRVKRHLDGGIHQENLKKIKTGDALFQPSLSSTIFKQKY